MEQRPNHFILVSCCLLVIATAGVYGAVVHYPFVAYDDQFYVTNNLMLQGGVTWKVFKWAWTAVGYAQNWHPLTWLSHALDCQLFGLNPGGHHLSNLAFHLLNLVILFLVLRRLTGAPGRSLLVTALFALHPLNVESVAWVAERKNVLSTLFFLLALGAYGWYATKPTINRYLTMVAFFVLGLLSKPMVITLPFVLLLLDFWPLDRVAEWRRVPEPTRKPGKKFKVQSGGLPAAYPIPPVPLSRLLLEKLPLLPLCAASAVLTIIAQRTESIRSLQQYSVSVRWENAIYAYTLYLRKAFWPTQLTLYYPHLGNTLTVWQIVGAALFLAGVSALVWKQRLSRRYLMMGWLWYLGTLVPVIGLVQVGDQEMADRYAYVPLIGIFVIVVWAAADWADSEKISMPWRAATAAIILALLLFLTGRQVGYWRSESDLWSHALEVVPTNTLAVCNLGDALQKTNQFEAALPYHQQCIRVYVADPTAHGNLAIDLVQLGRLQEAIQEYQTAIPLASEALMQSHYYDSLAAVYDGLEDYAKVRESYQQALKATPERGTAMVGWLTQSVADQPSAARYVQLGILLEETGKPSQARDAYQRALQLEPNLPEAKQFLQALDHDR